jgi:hypothetical protein
MPNLIQYHQGVQQGHIAPVALFASISWPNAFRAEWTLGDQHLRCEVDTFFNDFLVSSYIDAIRQYLSTPNADIRPGPYRCTTELLVPEQGSNEGMVTDSAIQLALLSKIKGGLSYTASTFYCVLVPPEVVVIDRNGNRSDDPSHGFDGYHGVFSGGQIGLGLVGYSVIVGSSDIEDLTYRLSHEMVEQLTDYDGSGWTGNPDLAVNVSIGVPAGNRPEVCDYTARPKVGATVHGWYVAPFAYEVDRTPDQWTMSIAPASDAVQRTNPDHGKIHFDTGFTRTSCMGDIIVGQEVYFTATASHYGQDQVISTLSWSRESAPPQSPAIEVNGTASRTYALDIPWGCTSVVVRCDIVTASLGCSVRAEQEFRVITPEQADQAAEVCAIVKILKAQRWFDPLWWIKRFNPEFNPKAFKVEEAITRIARKQGVGDDVLAEAKRLVTADLAKRIDAMIAAFHAPTDGATGRRDTAVPLQQREG